MRIKFLGAARTVTGSCFVMEFNGKRFAVDCGMHQGNSEIDARNWDLEHYDPGNLDFIILTHAHIDHSGLLPKAVQGGFSGSIYTTPPTRDLLEIMLFDSAHIQEMEAQWKSKKRVRHGKEPVDPLYSRQDVEKTLPLIQTQEYGREFSPADGIRVVLKDAGHILGSAFVEIWVLENGREYKLVFSGDLGRPQQLLVKDPSNAEKADFLFLESTYGNRDHKNEDESLDELAEAIEYSYSRGEKVVIPAFAVERTQELIYSLYLLRRGKRLPEDMPVFLDSPLAIRATEIFRRNHKYFDRSTRDLLQNGEDPLDLPNLEFSETAQDSMRINEMHGPAVIISASGMANAGRIKHHLRHNIWKKGASIVFVGFQAQGTPGRKIVDGAREIRILGESLAVNARVFTINGFSAHAGQSHILKWLSCFDLPGPKVFLVHGEHEGQKVLAERIRADFGFEVHIPDYLEECKLLPDKDYVPREFTHEARPGIDWESLFQAAENKLALLENRKEKISSMPWTDQTDLRDEFLEIDTALKKMVSSVGGE
ncbi:MAG: MBL fold metallo-hydrolase RNA specificity domain-containing protein [Desulfonatronovibrionaceae bacterium]